MIDFKFLKKIHRSRELDKRDFKKGIRADRNEKVEDWPKSIFFKIFNNILEHEFTSYYNTAKLHDLEKKIAKYLKVHTSNFVINHGGDGVIKEFLILNFKKKIKIMFNSNNYGMYNVYSKALKYKITQIPYKIDLKEKNVFKINKNFFYNNLKKNNIIILTNPNVVSNFDFKKNEINKMCRKYPNKVFFIDESYYGFGHYTCVDLATRNKNLFVLRSITKTFGLASARIGFLISHKDSIKALKALQTPYPVSLFGGKCLEYFLKNKNFVKNYNKQVEVGRDFFCNQLRKKGYLVNNGRGLSVMIYFESKRLSKLLYNKLIKNKIYVKQVLVNNRTFLRVTCGPNRTMRKILRYF